MACIWCKQEIKQPSEEHGIPDALGCPPALILQDVACRSCNGRLGVVDHALVKQFEAITVMLGIPRKRDRRPTIDSWRAIASEHRADGAHIHINAGPGVIEAVGKRLHPAAKSNGIFDVWHEPESGCLGYRQEFGNDRRFVPALYKIGLNLVAFHYGPAIAAEDKYDYVRSFVLGQAGAPCLKVIMNGSQAAPVTFASNPIVKPGRTWPLFNLQLLGVQFTLDLDPNQQGLRDLRAASLLYNEPAYFLPPG